MRMSTAETDMPSSLVAAARTAARIRSAISGRTPCSRRVHLDPDRDFRGARREFEATGPRVDTGNRFGGFAKAAGGDSLHDRKVLPGIAEGDRPSWTQFEPYDVHHPPRQRGHVRALGLRGLPQPVDGRLQPFQVLHLVTAVLTDRQVSVVLLPLPPVPELGDQPSAGQSGMVVAGVVRGRSDVCAHRQAPSACVRQRRARKTRARTAS